MENYKPKVYDEAKAIGAVESRYCTGPGRLLRLTNLGLALLDGHEVLESLNRSPDDGESG